MKAKMKRQLIADNGGFYYGTTYSKSCYYATSYGIGLNCPYMQPHILYAYSQILIEHLKHENVTFKEEMSKKGNVCRFIINMDINTHIELLKKLKA